MTTFLSIFSEAVNLCKQQGYRDLEWVISVNVKLNLVDSFKGYGNEIKTVTQQNESILGYPVEWRYGLMAYPIYLRDKEQRRIAIDYDGTIHEMERL